MKRKVLFAGAVSGVMLCLFMLVGPGVPLLLRLGVNPVCVQGEWPRPRVVSCPDFAGSNPPAELLPTLDSRTPIPILVDDDGSPDGMLALLYFLGSPRFDVQAVTISAGEAHPDRFAPLLLGLLAGLDRADIPVGAGRDAPLQGRNAFPEPWREASDAFWGLEITDLPVTAQPLPAAELIVETLMNAPQPVMVFVSGTHTNLAEALRLQPEIAAKIRSVHIMGGSIYVPGNIHSEWPSIDNRVAEWNIWVDPLAAAEVLGSGLHLYLTPLDATGQVLWTRSDLRNWSASNSPEGARAVDLFRWMLDSWSPDGVYIWDLVAAVNAADAAACAWIDLALRVATGTGPEQGRTVVENRPPNTAVCLEPNPERIKARAAEVFR